MKLRKLGFWNVRICLTIAVAWTWVFLAPGSGRAFGESVSGARQLGTVRVQTKKDLPIIFLPGVAGTRLYIRTGRLGLGQELWPMPPNEGIAQLFMGEDENPANSVVFPGDILRHYDETLPRFRWNLSVYNDFLVSIQSKEFVDGDYSWSYKENENLFVWGYDWRLDNAVHLKTLDQYVNRIRAQTQSKKILLIGHSMGGLIARAYARQHPNKVETLITIGSPFAGSPKPFYALAKGYTFGNPMVSEVDMKTLLQNAPSAYQLLPQYDFVSYDPESSELIPNSEFFAQINYRVGEMQSGWRATPGRMRSLSPELLAKARQFYDIVGTSFEPKALHPHVNHYAIIGVGIKTLQGYQMIRVEDANLEYKRLIGMRLRGVNLWPVWGDGDGTVPLKSAQIKNTARTYIIPHGHGPLDSAGHMELTNNGHVQHIVRSILTGYPFRKTGELDPTRTLVDLEPDADFTLR